MIVVYCQHHDALTSAERQMVAGMRDLSGILLVNALVTTGRRTREIDGIWIHPGGVAAIEAKGTAQHGEVVVHQNGPWTIGGQPADFPSGPNPLLQARSAAQTLRSTLTARGVDAGFLPAVVALAGSRLECSVRKVGDMTVLTTDDLSGLPQMLESVPVGVADVNDILAALDLGQDARPAADELAGEGFEPGSKLRPRQPAAHGGPLAPKPGPPRPGPPKPGPPKPGPLQRSTEDDTRAAEREDEHGDARMDRSGSSSRDRRRARRYADLEAQAHADWRRSHRRRIFASLVAAVVMAGYLPQLPLYCLANGAVCGAILAAYQLAVRRRLSGPRDHGGPAVALWVLTLLPVVGIGASLSWMGALPALMPDIWAFVLMLAILVAAGLGCAILTGRSAYIHPPAIVIERYDERGRPTGAFMLAQANPLHFPSKDWRPAEIGPIEN